MTFYLVQLTSVETARLLDAKSALLPANAIMIFESACRCSSLIQAFAFSNDDYYTKAGEKEI
jgi:hypothetical protein